MFELNGVEKIVFDARRYWRLFESYKYSRKNNSNTGNSYEHDARRLFVKYALAHTGLFYTSIANRGVTVTKYGLLLPYPKNETTI